MDENEKKRMYRMLSAQLSALLDDCPWPLTAMANMSSLIFHGLPDLNWAGFYLFHRDMLILGPFQGKVACTQIAMGKGVCGTAAQTGTVQLVRDVHQFPGHIACDSASNAEVVIPLFHHGTLCGVLDLDSPVLSRFDEEDVHGLESLCQLLMARLDWTGGLLP